MFEMLVNYDVQKVRREERLEGIKIGEQKEKFEVAKNLLKEGIDVSIIIKATRLLEEDVRRLKESNQH